MFVAVGADACKNRVGRPEWREGAARGQDSCMTPAILLVRRSGVPRTLAVPGWRSRRWIW